MLKINNLRKSYSKSGVYALDGVSLELKEGEIFGFLGPNGAGKTTAIKILSGILPFEEGSVSVCGHDIKTHALLAKQNIGYVSDTHIVYDKLTGREYVDFLADIYNVPLSERKERAEKMLSLFELTENFNSPIKTYSHGMKQKIAVIGALIHNPKLWVLDEPLTGLDPKSAFNMKELMREHASRGNTVFFSTHILEVAEKLCDRIGIIVKGKIAKVGCVEEITANYKDKSLEEIFLSVAT
ncbi:MAG: ABC transporter ATP-binding protein [Firmicutes bacterium]|nr:ABC transporter ATP-binding protein [Bacillota bacterium]MCL2256511.1 ABC transporter ATP-binding protein [Bacillota bacterium]